VMSIKYQKFKISVVWNVWIDVHEPYMWSIVIRMVEG
jgi:hypothetical protein